MEFIKCLTTLIFFKRYQVVYITGNGTCSTSFKVLRLTSVSLKNLIGFIEETENINEFCITNIIEDTWFNWKTFGI